MSLTLFRLVGVVVATAAVTVSVATAASMARPDTTEARRDIRVETQSYLAEHPEVVLRISGKEVPDDVVAFHAVSAWAAAARDGVTPAGASVALVRSGAAAASLQTLLLLEGRRTGLAPTARDVDAFLAQQQAALAETGSDGPQSAAVVSGHTFDVGNRAAAVATMTMNAMRRAVVGSATTDAERMAALRTWFATAAVRHGVTLEGAGAGSPADLAGYLM